MANEEEKKPEAGSDYAEAAKGETPPPAGPKKQPDYSDGKWKGRDVNGWRITQHMNND